MEDPLPNSHIDFTNTEQAFAHKSDKDLKDTYSLFKMMSNSSLVGIGSKLGGLAAKLNINLINRIIRNTIFKQFCGGESLMDSQNTIDDLRTNNTLTILDYGLEGKSSDEEIEAIHAELIRATEFAASNTSVPVSVLKLSALADNAMLEAYAAADTPDEAIQAQFDRLLQRVDAVCSLAEEHGVGIFVDAEESWIQDTIDDIVMQMMLKYNKNKCVVFNTFQMYRKDRLDFLKASFAQTQKEGVYLGAKLVRGAYMEKERARATANGYLSPIHDTKADTDKAFNDAVTFCIQNYERIGSCCATHNVDSNQLQVNLIEEHNADKQHPHINFCQLYGMSDYITFNLADNGFNVAKYVPYGPIKEVIPYLVRRAQENTSVTGEMGRELSFLDQEMKRRGIRK